MQQVPNRKTLVALLLATLVIVLIIILIAFLLRPKELKISQPFATGVRFAKQIDSSNIYFFTGSAFASYNLESYTTTGLTPFYALPNQVRDIRISSRGALLQAGPYSVADSLHKTLVDNGLNPSFRYWWLFDFETDKPTLLGSIKNSADVRHAVWQDADTFVYTSLALSDNTSELQVMRANVGSQPVKIAAIHTTATLIAATENDILYLLTKDQRQTVIQLDLTTSQETDVTSDYFIAGSLGASSDGSLLLVGDTKASADGHGAGGEAGILYGNLLLYNNQTKNTEKITDNFGGQVASWHPDGKQWLTMTSSNRDTTVVSGNGNNVQRFTVKVSDPTAYTPLGIAPKGMLVVNSNNDLSYLSEQELTDLPSLRDPISALGVYYNSSVFSMAYNESSLQFNIYINTPPNKAGMDAALEYMRNKGVDPYQIKTKWYGANGPDF